MKDTPQDRLSEDIMEDRTGWIYRRVEHRKMGEML
jgi:hypothetical protein